MITVKYFQYGLVQMGDLDERDWFARANAWLTPQTVARFQQSYQPEERATYFDRLPRELVESIASTAADAGGPRRDYRRAPWKPFEFEHYYNFMEAMGYQTPLTHRDGSIRFRWPSRARPDDGQPFFKNWVDVLLEPGEEFHPDADRLTPNERWRYGALTLGAVASLATGAYRWQNQQKDNKKKATTNAQVGTAKSQAVASLA